MVLRRKSFRKKRAGRMITKTRKPKSLYPEPTKKPNHNPTNPTCQTLERTTDTPNSRTEGVGPCALQLVGSHSVIQRPRLKNRIPTHPNSASPNPKSAAFGRVRRCIDPMVRSFESRHPCADCTGSRPINLGFVGIVFRDSGFWVLGYGFWV